MSLPRDFLDELRNRTSLIQVVGRKVDWDNRKSNQSSGDMWSPCPFHQEKSASFHVDNRKGFYYCFGCHAKGDVFSFIRKTENVSFIDAVRILAREAGMHVPEAGPRAQAKADKRVQMVEVMELAVQHFRQHLKSAVGTEARNFLQRHLLNEASQDRFDIGFALETWQGLCDHLKAENVPDEMILDCGLAKPSSKGGKPYDTFRGRIMFPFRDAQGSCIAFGSWAIGPNNNPEYLNSPKTELFDGSCTLFNHGPAREAAVTAQPLIVSSGYLDVIALLQCGFEAVVAPLAAAMTETHLKMIWRISSEPVILLDNNASGLRTANRVINLALPLLEADKSLRFALVPPSMGNVDLIQIESQAAVQALVDNPRPMLQLLWELETKGRNFDSPERKAALDKALREKIQQIRDPSIREHYKQTIKDLRWQLFKPHRITKEPDSDIHGQRRPRAERSVRKLDYIVCECSCGKTSELFAEQLGPVLGEDLTAANSLSLMPKLRCSECGSTPSKILDDKNQLLFGQAEPQ